MRDPRPRGALPRARRRGPTGVRTRPSVRRAGRVGLDRSSPGRGRPAAQGLRACPRAGAGSRAIRAFLVARVTVRRAQLPAADDDEGAPPVARGTPLHSNGRFAGARSLRHSTHAAKTDARRRCARAPVRDDAAGLLGAEWRLPPLAGAGRLRRRPPRAWPRLLDLSLSRAGPTLRGAGSPGMARRGASASRERAPLIEGRGVAVTCRTHGEPGADRDP